MMCSNLGVVPANSVHKNGSNSSCSKGAIKSDVE